MGHAVRHRHARLLRTGGNPVNPLQWIRDEAPPGLLLFWLIGVFVVTPLAVYLALWITDAI